MKWHGNATLTFSREEQNLQNNEEIKDEVIFIY